MTCSPGPGITGEKTPPWEKAFQGPCTSFSTPLSDEYPPQIQGLRLPRPPLRLKPSHRAKNPLKARRRRQGLPESATQRKTLREAASTCLLAGRWAAAGGVFAGRNPASCAAGEMATNALIAEILMTVPVRR